MKKKLWIVILLGLMLLNTGMLNDQRAVIQAADGSRLISINFYKADLVAVLQQLALESGYNVIITPEVRGEITVCFQNCTFEEALQSIIKAHGLVSYQEGRNIFIGCPGQLPNDQKITGHFKLDYADPKQVVELMRRVFKDAEVLADERIRTVIIYSTRKDLEQAAALIETLDRKMQQLNIEVKVIEVSVSALRRLGIEWQIDNHSMSWGLTSSGAELILQMISRGHSWSAIFKSLITNGEARLVTAPSVSTVEGKEASILIGDKIPVENRDKDGNITVEYIDVGVKLVLTPWMQQDNEISIDLKTEVNSVGEKNGNYFRIGARELRSKIQTKIGETIFLGGLITQEDRKNLMKVPVVGELPLFGNLFRYSQKTQEETELIITITPRWNNSINITTETVTTN
ncbi:MAG TPA: secretin N-terminal domain-containing protein [Bacillota bacterium]|jgi:type II secretory pathway component GspD/PulD (secretin)|nr:secretin N-terminal domain-containing protein [Bacillota bacterium]HOL10453.1 secretin N-terminal domain-containing protein [Bacillota bacterium]HPO98154.1 secretin N-terminal domain-containing protein [Bacillota bacterium]